MCRQEISKVWTFFFGLDNMFILSYTTSDYYGIIKGQMGYSAACFILFLFFCSKIPFLIKLKQILKKWHIIVQN